MAINEQTLESFLSGNLSILDEIIGTDAAELKNILNSSTITAMGKSEILNQVSVASSASAQKAILNTRLNTYSRVATNTMMKDAPSDTKYVYVGPIDDRTRDECLEYASAGALTEADIIGNGWTASLVDGGGINCRHKWEIASDEGIKLFEGKQAQQVIAGKQNNITNLSMAGKHIKSKDATNYMKQNFGVNNVKGIDNVEVLNQINKSFKKQQDLGVKIGYKEIYTYKGSAGELARSSTKTLGIDISKGSAFIKKTIKKQESKGWLFRGSKDIKSIIAHESGHSLSKMHIGGSGKIWTETGKKFDKIHKRYLKEINQNKKDFLKKYKSMSKSKQNTYKKSFKNKKDKLRAFYGDAFVSEYSLTNVQEFIAESYSMAIYSNEPSHYATEVFNLIKSINE